MTRFYIDKDNGETRHCDQIGVDLANPAEARAAVLDALPEMARDKLPDGDRRTFRAMARDENGKPVYRATMTRVGTWD